MTRLENISTPTEIDLLVCFTDLTKFHKGFVMLSSDRLVFETMRDYYAWAGKLIQSRGGTVIKCIGDAMMLVFPAEEAGKAVMALKELKSLGDEWLKKRDLPCQHQVKLHLGPVVAGPIGAPGQERFDVYGKTVNICATLGSGPFIMSPQVFRALDGETRKHFKKHTPPVTYIRTEDGH